MEDEAMEDEADEAMGRCDVYVKDGTRMSKRGKAV
jgi:hypothetical protein